MKKLGNFFIDLHNVKYIILVNYSCPNSIDIENQMVSTKKVTKKEEPINLNLGEPREGKTLAFPVSLR